MCTTSRGRERPETTSQAEEKLRIETEKDEITKLAEERANVLPRIRGLVNFLFFTLEVFHLLELSFCSFPPTTTLFSPRQIVHSFCLLNKFTPSYTRHFASKPTFIDMAWVSSLLCLFLFFLLLLSSSFAHDSSSLSFHHLILISFFFLFTSPCPRSQSIRCPRLPSYWSSKRGQEGSRSLLGRKDLSGGTSQGLQGTKTCHLWDDQVSRCWRRPNVSISEWASERRKESEWRLGWEESFQTLEEMHSDL